MKLETMARYQSSETNSQVTREAAERLQVKLYQAAEAALDIALVDQKIPANLLSSCQAILRDANLTPDLAASDEDEAAAEEQSRWVDDLEADLGL